MCDKENEVKDKKKGGRSLAFRDLNLSVYIHFRVHEFTSTIFLVPLINMHNDVNIEWAHKTHTHSYTLSNNTHMHTHTFTDTHTSVYNSNLNSSRHLMLRTTCPYLVIEWCLDVWRSEDNWSHSARNCYLQSCCCRMSHSLRWWKVLAQS